MSQTQLCVKVHVQERRHRWFVLCQISFRKLTPTTQPVARVVVEQLMGFFAVL